MPFTVNPPDQASDRANDMIKNSDTANFAADVIEVSARVPVIVDFRSHRSDLCQQMSPIIEKLVRQFGGKVRLVKIDVDRDQALAMQLRIQTVPTAMAFHQGRPVDTFSGAWEESQLKAFVERLAKKTVSGATLKDADAKLAAGDIDGARALYDAILADKPSSGGATGGKIRCELAAGDIAAANRIVADLGDKTKSLPAVEAAINALELDASASDPGKIDELAKKMADDQNDHATRFDLAMARYANGDIEGAINELLELVRRDHKWNGEAARKQLIKIFTARGFTDPVTVSGRKRLSVILFS